jgi:hypothetical protein
MLHEQALKSLDGFIACAESGAKGDEDEDRD